VRVVVDPVKRPIAPRVVSAALGSYGERASLAGGLADGAGHARYKTGQGSDGSEEATVPRAY
jgi:hypothetical protein